VRRKGDRQTKRKTYLEPGNFAADIYGGPLGKKGKKAMSGLRWERRGGPKEKRYKNTHGRKEDI